MRSSKPHIGIQYYAELPYEPIRAFSSEIHHPELDYVEDSKSELGPYAGLEWLLPTAVVLYISRPYFKAFLSEAGKDHYQILRKAVVKLSQKFIGKSAPKVCSVSAGGKGKEPSGKYSLAYSIVAELSDGLRFKLLIEAELEPKQIELATTALLDCIKAFHDGMEFPLPIKGLESAKPSGGTLLVHYNIESASFKVIDPNSK